MKRIAFFFVFIAALMSLSFVQQGLKTQLRVTVIDEIGNIVEGATVKVYESQTDYNDSKSVVFEQVTDHKGRTRIVGLKDQVYFLEVVKDKKDNSLGAVQTAKLVKGRINKLNIIIE
jgi:uncharacterized protein (DUF2141 family)